MLRRCGDCEEVWGLSVGKCWGEVWGRCQVSVGGGEGRCEGCGEV